MTIGFKGIPANSPWPVEHDDALRAHIEARYLSFRGIATAINEKFGTSYSRSAVIGRAGRMGLKSPEREKKPRGPRKHSKNKASQHVVFRIVAANGNSNALRIVKSVQTDSGTLRCVEIEPRHLTLMDLERNDCHYPFGGDGQPITFCGHPRRDDKTSYCGPHHALVWTAPRPTASTDKYFSGRLRGGRPWQKVVA